MLHRSISPQASAVFLGLCAGVAAGSPNVPVRAQWTQWGGANRDFVVDAVGLADRWADDGPTELWRRALGHGHSSILVDDGRLYTMYRAENEEIVVCLSASTGEIIWTHRYAAPARDDLKSWGYDGPHATPLIVGQRVFTMGTDTMLHCLNKETGKVLWRHDLPKEMGAKKQMYGYSSSPIAFGDTVIVMVGGRSGQSIVAFDQATGKTVWKNQSFDFTHASPILIRVGGQDQLLCFMAAEVIGVDPKSGSLLWSHPFPTDLGANIVTPLWSPDDGLLFLTAAWDHGSRVLRLTQDDRTTHIDELWYQRKMQVQHGNVFRIGDFVYGSSKRGVLTAINIHTGKIAWRDRTFARATGLLAGERLILLDEDGTLALTTPRPDGLIVHSKCQPLQNVSWTPPTLVGTTLYLRDRLSVVALDLGDNSRKPRQ